MGELGLLAQELSDATMSVNRKLDARFVEAVNHRDVELAMACFVDSPGLVVVLDGNTLHGPAQVRQFLVEAFSTVRAVRLGIEQVSHFRLGETIFAAGNAVYESEAHRGKKAVLRGAWTDARQRIAGRWVYCVLHVTRLAG
jgi:ketosteroid isomerase-like protein